MIFFLSGRPTALLKYQIILIARSLASEPDEVKCALAIPPGAMRTSRSASAIAEGCDLCENE